MEERALANLRTTMSKLRGELDRSRDRYGQTRQELRDAEQRVHALAKALRILEGKIGAQRRRMSELEHQKAALNASVAHQRNYLAQQLRAAYAMGEQEYVRLLLNQEDPATVGRVLAYYSYFNHARTERISSLQETLRELEELQAALERETAELGRLRNERAREKDNYEQVRRQRAVLLTKIQGDITSQDRRLDELASQERELQAVLQSLREVVKPEQYLNGRFAQLKGKLPWPTRGPVRVNYGAQRAQGTLRWEGVLIAAQQGQEVRAVAQGRVVFADWLRGYGLLVVLDHGDGYMSLYAHNQSLFRETGDFANAGDVIATVGDSGGQESEALYFEIRHNGQPVDPAKWCRRSQG